MAIYTFRAPDHTGISKVEITSQNISESTQKPGASCEPPPRLLNQFTERVHKCAASIKDSLNKAGTAILNALGALAFGFGAVAFIVMSWLKSCAGGEEDSGAGAGDTQYRFTIDLDDPVTAWIDPAHADGSNPAPQTETTINLTPAKTTDPVADFDNLIAEISGTD